MSEFEKQVGASSAGQDFRAARSAYFQYALLLNQPLATRVVTHAKTDNVDGSVELTPHFGAYLAHRFGSEGEITGVTIADTYVRVDVTLYPQGDSYEDEPGTRQDQLLISLTGEHDHIPPKNVNPFDPDLAELEHPIDYHTTPRRILEELFAVQLQTLRRQNVELTIE